MKQNLLLYLFLLLVSVGSLRAQSALDYRLFELPDVIFKPIEQPEGFEAAYELRVKQPLDHQHPEKGHFYQRVFLSHAGYDQPTVIVTEGYDRSNNRIYELTNLLHANQVLVEHRFFGESKPENYDWQYLTLEQATADLHKINQLFHNLYNGPWVSTGISKGGQTSIFYRYFYPDDVAVSVPYVAPLNLEFADPRIYDFLAKAGSKECQEAIYNFQIRMLKERDQILPRLEWYAKGQGMTFTYMSLEAAFEYAILEYPFSFWQSGQNCQEVPSKNADIDALIEYFNRVVGLSLYSDAQVESYGPHYYQAASQMGYYGFETKRFKKLLKALPEHPHAAFIPKGAKVKFDNTLVKKVSEWLAQKGNNIIYIYGAVDTWTATGVPPSDATNSVWFNMEGKSHSTARIRNMNAVEKEKLEMTLEKWLGIEVEE
ncbi:MAG: tripeptidyl aminopeptidase [Saprospiraceae bacterium]|nr:MAG: tripeptidyl aminopeptidase [Saprospiraceae bacterium]